MHPPTDADARPMGFSEDDREAFRWRIEALLNGVLRIQAMAEREEPTDVIRRNRIDLCIQAAKLMSDVCGDWVKISENDAQSELDYVCLNLRVWQPVLAMHDKNDWFWDDAIDEIERMHFGDTPELFKPRPRPPGAHNQPAKLAQSRLSALQWIEYLKQRGIRPKIYKPQISLAYGADSEAIRKWPRLISNVFGENYVKERLDLARDGYGLAFEFPSYLKALHRWGTQHRLLTGLRPIPLQVFSDAFPGQDSG